MVRHIYVSVRIAFFQIVGHLTEGKGVVRNRTEQKCCRAFFVFKIYPVLGSVVLALDVKKVGDTKWIRGWANNFDHKNDKHTIVVSDGTAEQALDVFDLWKDFSNFEKGVLVY